MVDLNDELIRVGIQLKKELNLHNGTQRREGLEIQFVVNFLLYL